MFQLAIPSILTQLLLILLSLRCPVQPCVRQLRRLPIGPVAYQGLYQSQSHARVQARCCCAEFAPAALPVLVALDHLRPRAGAGHRPRHAGFLHPAGCSTSARCTLKQWPSKLQLQQQQAQRSTRLAGPRPWRNAGHAYNHCRIKSLHIVSLLAPSAGGHALYYCRRVGGHCGLCHPTCYG